MQYIKDEEILFAHEVRQLHPTIIFAPTTYAELGWAEYTPPPPVPDTTIYVPLSVSRFQARAILRIDGTFDLVDGLVAQADLTTPEGIILYTAWHDAEEFLRHSPSILAIAAILGWTDAYLDDMFIRASAIAA